MGIMDIVAGGVQPVDVVGQLGRGVQIGAGIMDTFRDQTAKAKMIGAVQSGDPEAMAKAAQEASVYSPLYASNVAKSSDAQNQNVDDRIMTNLKSSFVIAQKVRDMTNPQDQLAALAAGSKVFATAGVQPDDINAVMQKIQSGDTKGANELLDQYIDLGNKVMGGQQNSTAAQSNFAQLQAMPEGPEKEQFKAMLGLGPQGADKAPSGYRYNPDGTLAPIKGGPADKPQAGQAAPSGYRYKADGALEPIPGGPADPETKSNTPLGSREMTQIGRVQIAANEVARDLENVSKMPLTVSRGVFGGREQGPSLFAAGKEALTNKLTSQEVQSYNVMSTGFQRSLAAIEAAGLMPSGSLTHQMDAVLFKEGDTNLTKMQKLAQTRQVVEAGLEAVMSRNLPPKVHEQMQSVLDKLEKSVPYTQNDLITLQQAQESNPKATLNDVMLPKNATEEDVDAVMQAHGLTRAQALMEMNAISKSQK